jgi:hypothetical protein
MCQIVSQTLFDRAVKVKENIFDPPSKELTHYMIPVLVKKTREYFEQLKDMSQVETYKVPAKNDDSDNDYMSDEDDLIDDCFPEYFNCDNIIIKPTSHFSYKYEDGDIVHLIKILCTQGVYDLGIKCDQLPCY